MVYQLSILQFPKAFVLVFIQPSLFFKKKNLFLLGMCSNLNLTLHSFNSTSLIMIYS